MVNSKWKVTVVYLLFTIHHLPVLFLQRMSASGGNANLGTVTFNLISGARRLARLRIDQLDVGNVNKGFLLDDAAAPIALRVGPLVSLDHSGAFNFDSSRNGRYFEHATTLALVTAGNNHH